MLRSSLAAFAVLRSPLLRHFTTCPITKCTVDVSLTTLADDSGKNIVPRTLGEDDLCLIHI